MTALAPVEPDRAQFQVSQLIGRLTANPTIAERKGTQVGNLRIAMQRPRKNGEDQGADYVDITVFGRQAETCAQYLAKGRKIAVTGRLSHSEWTAEDGGRRQKLEVIANTVDFLDRAPGPTTEPEIAEVTA